MKTPRWPLAAAAVVTFAISGCSGGDGSEAEAEPPASPEASAEATEEAVEQITGCQAAVAFLEETRDDLEYQATHTFEAVDDALLACEQLGEFEAAVEEHPDAVEGDPANLVTNRCEYSEELGAATICDDV